MSAVLRLLYGMAVAVEDRFDTGWFRFKRRRGWVRPVEIMPYLGYGTADVWHLKGRVLEARGLAPAREEDRVWNNLRMAYRRFQSNEVPHVRVQARAAGAEQIVETDHEGYFNVTLHPRTPLPQGRIWHDVALTLLDDIVPGQGPVTAIGRVQVPPETSEFGLISDIDDTVLKTGATDLWQMARLTFLRNAHTRLPFEGVAAFYRALEMGRSDAPQNPVFYVSSSPWNLYDLLLHFFELQDLPAGTLFLRDLGLERNLLHPLRHDAHKLEQIERVLSAYPHLPFLLIGDSGQRDPEIYAQVVADFPGRVRAIYIREVTSGARESAVNALAEQVRRQGVELLLVTNTKAAIRHAAERGFLDAARVAEVLDETIDNAQPLSQVAGEVIH